MAYLLSATKLKSYARCPKAYYFRYECGLSNQTAFTSAALGTALHTALAQLYQDWHYQEPLPSEAWLRSCWDSQIAGLTNKQTEEGWQILQRYCDREIILVNRYDSIVTVRLVAAYCSVFCSTLSRRLSKTRAYCGA